MFTLITALPISVAQKKVLNGIKNWPHAIPHKSNAILGHAESNRTAQNPYQSILSIIHCLIQINTSGDNDDDDDNNGEDYD